MYAFIVVCSKQDEEIVGYFGTTYHMREYVVKMHELGYTYQIHGNVTNNLEFPEINR